MCNQEKQHRQDLLWAASFCFWLLAIHFPVTLSWIPYNSKAHHSIHSSFSYSFWVFLLLSRLISACYYTSQRPSTQLHLWTSLWYILQVLASMMLSFHHDFFWSHIIHSSPFQNGHEPFVLRYLVRQFVDITVVLLPAYQHSFFLFS